MCELCNGTGRIQILHLWGDNYLWRICPCMENNNGYINGGFERNESHLIRDPPKCEPCGFEGHEWY
jgi:hypothetical protein